MAPVTVRTPPAPTTIHGAMPGPLESPVGAVLVAVPVGAVVAVPVPVGAVSVAVAVAVVVAAVLVVVPGWLVAGIFFDRLVILASIRSSSSPLGAPRAR